MKRIHILGLVFVLLAGWNAFSQTYIAQVSPFGSDKWTYAGINGKIIFNTLFFRCSEFSKEGFATVYDDNREMYYIIDIQGKIIPAEIKDFEIMSVFYIKTPKGFSDGLVPVRQGNKWGFLNTSGKVAIPIKYNKVTEFNGGFATAEMRGKWIVLDKDGGERPVNDVSVIEMKSFSENFAPYESNKGRMGFINEKGEIAIPAQFLAVGYFSGGLAWVRMTNDRLGYIDTSGRWIIQPLFEVAKNYDTQTDWARIILNGLMGFVNKQGEIMYMEAEDFGNFANGLCWGRKNGKVGFFNRNGEWIIAPRYEAVRDFKNGYAAAKINERWGMIDMQGNWVISPSFEEIKDMERVEEVFNQE